MFLTLVKQMLGPIGRWLMDNYATNSVLFSVVLAGWMVVVGVGQHGVNRLRWQVRTWVRQLAPAGTPSPEHLLEVLESQWLEASRGIRWMPTAKGFWTGSAKDSRLRELAGFTPSGANLLIKGLAEAGKGPSALPRHPTQHRGVIRRAARRASRSASRPKEA